jgi:hypothetical protein
MLRYRSWKRTEMHDVIDEQFGDDEPDDDGRYDAWA